MSKISAYLIACCCLALLLGSHTLRAQTWRWAQAAGQAESFIGTSKVLASARAADGSTYVGGTFLGTVILGPFTLISSGGADGFVARLDTTGAWVQIAQVAGGGSESVSALAVTPAGGVVVGGTYVGSDAVFGQLSIAPQSPQPYVVGYDGFVARLNRNGRWTQAVAINGPGEDYVDKLVVGHGGVTIAGHSSSPSLTFGDTTLTLPPNTYSPDNMFAARLNPRGQWVHAVSALGGGYTKSIALNDNGTAVLAGYFYGPSLTLGSTVLTNKVSDGTSTDMFVAWLGPGGRWRRAVQAGRNRPTNEFLQAMALAPNGDVVVAGDFYLSTEFGNITLTAPASHRVDIFVARLNNQGRWLQAVGAGGSSGEQVAAIAVDDANRVTVAGIFGSGQTVFGPHALTTTASRKVFLARLEPGGTWDYAAQAGGASEDFCTSLSLGTTGYLTVTGYFQRASAMAFGPFSIGALRSSFCSTCFSTTGFVAQLAPPVPAAPAPLLLAPNPAPAQTTVSLPAAAQARPVVVLDAYGHEVQRRSLPAHATQLTLNVNGLLPGVYVVRCGASSARLQVE